MSMPYSSSFPSADTVYGMADTSAHHLNESTIGLQLEETTPVKEPVSYAGELWSEGRHGGDVAAVDAPSDANTTAQPVQGIKRSYREVDRDVEMEDDPMSGGEKNEAAGGESPEGDKINLMELIMSELAKSGNQIPIDMGSIDDEAFGRRRAEVGEMQAQSVQYVYMHRPIKRMPRRYGRFDCDEYEDDDVEFII